MPDYFQFHIRTPTDTQPFKLNVGEIFYILGANGTGKSSLVSEIFRQNSVHAKRISAHRQTWFESNTLDLTPRGRQDLESGFRSQDIHPRARYWEWNPAQRSTVAIFDLIDADTILARKIADLVRSRRLRTAWKEAREPGPLEVLNELMRLAKLPIAIDIQEGQKIVARKNGGMPYSVAELSDGERNAFLLAADVLTAKPGTLVLIDEPERHLHRSIISPLLTLLFGKRPDCAFVISTHEIMLPVDTPQASTLLVRDCEYKNQQVETWTLDLLAPGAAISEDLKRDLLGARRKILFIEGTAQSLDFPLYILLFPDVSIIAKESCRDVEYAVRGLRSVEDIHWVAACGIVDNDQRDPTDIQRLKNAGIWALSHYSVEAFYYHPKILSRIAERQAASIGANAQNLVSFAISDAIQAVKLQKEHLVSSAVLRAVRNQLLGQLPARSDIHAGSTVELKVDTSALFQSENARFDALIAASDWDGLLARYPVRESPAFERIISGLKVKDQATYRAMVLKLLQDDQQAVTDLLALLADLPSALASA